MEPDEKIFLQLTHEFHNPRIMATFLLYLIMDST